MSKSLKKILVTSASLLMMASVGAGMNNVSAHHVSKARKHRVIKMRRHRTFKVHAKRTYKRSVKKNKNAWRKGLPKELQGNYESYKRTKAPVDFTHTIWIAHKSFIKYNPYTSPDPLGIKNISSKRIGLNEYIIHGYDVNLAGTRSYSNILISKTKHGINIRYLKPTINNKHYKREYKTVTFFNQKVNGTYYRIGNTKNVRKLNRLMMNKSLM